MGLFVEPGLGSGGIRSKAAKDQIKNGRTPVMHGVWQVRQFIHACIVQVQ